MGKKRPYPTAGRPAGKNENHVRNNSCRPTGVMNRREVMNSLLAPTAKKTEGKKRNAPSTPKEKKGRVKKDRRGFSKKPSFACAGARVGATAFQAFLNRRFPKDKPRNENIVRNNSRPMGRATMVRRNSAAEGGAA